MANKKHDQKPKCKAYRGRHTREQNKIVRVARSNGYRHALEYADKHGLTTWATRRLINFTFNREAAQ